VISYLSRPFALVFTLCLLALSVWCLTTTPPPIKTAKRDKHGVLGYTDARLYHDIASAVAKGEPYHAAAAKLHRAHHYPLRPFVTMRPPTEMVMAAHIGWKGFQGICFALLVGGIFGWVMAYEGRLLWPERIGMGVAVAVGGSFIASDWILALQEYPAGLCITVAMAGMLAWPRQWWINVAVLGLGLFIRETVLPMVLLMLAYAAWNRRWAQVGAWGALLVAWGAFMAWHRMEAMAQWTPQDLVSQGWKSAQGFSGFLKAVIYTSPLQTWPKGPALLAAMLPMVGWLAIGRREGAFAALAVGGMALMIALFSRADTFYWGGIMLPWYFVGYALLPRAFYQLFGALRGQPLGRIKPLA
jgi:hypothetical protein